MTCWHEDTRPLIFIWIQDINQMINRFWHVDMKIQDLLFLYGFKKYIKSSTDFDMLTWRYQTSYFYMDLRYTWNDQHILTWWSEDTRPLISIWIQIYMKSFCHADIKIPYLLFRYGFKIYMKWSTDFDMFTWRYQTSHFQWLNLNVLFSGF